MTMTDLNDAEIGRMLSGLFARFGSLQAEKGAGYTLLTRTDGRMRTIGVGDTLADAIRSAWIQERDRLHKALEALGAVPVADSLSGVPAGPETAQERPQAWASMDTCPRGPDSRLTEDVWLRWGLFARVDRMEAGRGLPELHDVVYGRHGWLPGYIAESDLPHVEVTP